MALACAFNNRLPKLALLAASVASAGASQNALKTPAAIVNGEPIAAEELERVSRVRREVNVSSAPVGVSLTLPTAVGGLSE